MSTSKQKSNPPRVVPAFTYQSVQKNTVVQKPPKSNALTLCKNGTKPANHKTKFREAYQRDDLPLRLNHQGTYPKLQWRVTFDEIDYDKWLPIFMSGLTDTMHPCGFLAESGTLEMVEHGKERVLSPLPFCIGPLKEALNSKQPPLMIAAMKIMQSLAVNVPYGGEALVPYYRQLLPPLSRFKDRNINIGDAVEFDQRKRTNLGDLIEETLQILEKAGGTDAFINILYVIPTYQSCKTKR